MDLGVTDKLVLVTGSTEGIGFAIAKEFAIHGARVIVTSRTQAKIDKAIEKLVALDIKHKPVGFPSDLSTAEGANFLIEEVDKVGELDILVNNLGIFQISAFFETEDEVWQRHFEANVMSAVRLSRHWLPKMIERCSGDNIKGKSQKDAPFARILMMSSETSQRPLTQFLHYSMSKAAMNSVARGLAELTRGSNVTVNSILAGPTWTEGVESYLSELAESNGISVEEQTKKYFSENEPNSILERFIQPKEIADVSVFIASRLASAVNGHNQRVEGGILRFH